MGRFKVVLAKGFSKRAKSSISSASQARRISKAITMLQDYRLNDLIKSGKVKELSVVENTYMFRSGFCERIIFSLIDQDKIVIQDIISISKDNKIKSMMYGNW